MEKENNKKFVSRVLILAIAMALIIPTGLTYATFQENENVSMSSEYITIQIDGPEDIQNIPSDVRIVEVYNTFVMAEVNSDQKLQVQRNHQVDSVPGRNEFSFNGYSFDVQNGKLLAPDNLMIDRNPPDLGYYFVKFTGPVKQEWLDAVEGAGAKIYGSADRFSVLVGMSEDVLFEVENMDSVIWTGIFQPAYKVSQKFNGLSGEVPVKIYTFPERQGKVSAEMGKLFARNNGQGKFFTDYSVPTHIVDGEVGIVRAEIDVSLIDDIARLPGIMRIELFEQPKTNNDMSHSITQSGTTTLVGAPSTLESGSYGATVPIWNQGLFGQGLVYGCSDSGLRLDHDLFRDAGWDNDNIALNISISHRKITRYINFESAAWDHWAEPDNDHGTHVVGTSIGYDNPVSGTSNHDGMAPGAKVSFSDIGNSAETQYVYPPDDYYLMWQPAKDDGARAFTQSWGSPAPTEYTGDHLMVDQWVYDNPEFLFTWSAGNEGAAGIGNQASAKNTIAIGACGDTQGFPDQSSIEEVATFSSRGPTFDNRLKPDIMASGSRVDSADSQGTDSYVPFSGTSMSAPNAIGGLLLANQYFLEGWYPTGAEVPGNAFDPSHNLIKALLVNGADQMTDSNANTLTYDIGNGPMDYPNPDQGWGRMNLDKSLYFSSPVEDARKLQVFDGDNGVETDNYVEYRYFVIDNSQDLTVTTCWNDYPATVGASASLVNDLDLSVTIGADVYKGNVFTGSSPAASSVANTGNYDHLNNLENVLVAAADLPAGGAEIIVRVSGYSVPFAPQPFAIVLSGNLDLEYGTVQLDKDLYGLAETATVRVEDAEKSGSVQVSVSSAGSGDSEDITLSETGSGVFEGTISFTLNTADPSGNGILAVTGTDTIDAAYDDTAGANPHISHAYAEIDGYGPAISNVRTELVTMASAEIAWDLSEQGNATVYYGTNPSSLIGVEKVESPYILTAMVPLTGLTGNTLYYYDVESIDLHGNAVRDDNGGDHYTFTTTSKGDILVVITDRANYDYLYVIDCYRWSINYAAWSSNIWPTWMDGDPTLSDLQDYKAVIWQVGQEKYPPFNADERALIKDYNDEGGRLWVVSHDTMWALGDLVGAPQYASTESISWLAGQMKSTYVNDRLAWDPLYGTAADPISGAYTGGIVYQQPRDGAAGDEISPVASGGITTIPWVNAFDDVGVKWVSSSNNGSAGTGVWGGTPSKFVASWWEWAYLLNGDTVEEAVRADILDKTINWLIGHDHPDVTVTYPNTGEVIVTDSINVAWSRTTYGGTNVDSTSLFYSPNAGDAWYLVSDTIGTATSYNWDISSLDNGNNYLVRVVVADDGVPSLIGSDDCDTTFTINRATGDTTGPVVQAGSVRAEPNPVDQFNTIWFNATIDDSNKGNSDVSEAEFYIDDTGGTPTPMSPADGAWDNPLEDVTWNGAAIWTIGDHTLYVRGRDDKGNWGNFDTTLFTINAGSGPAPEAYPIPIDPSAGADDWVFVSFPYVMSGPIETVLDDSDITSGSGTQWDIAKWYDASDKNDPWKTYNKNNPASLNDLTTIDQTMGVWLHLTATDGTLTTGTLGAYSSVPVNVDLYTGWNLVGYPTENNEFANVALAGTGATWIASWQLAAPYVVDTTDLASTPMIEGEAYWVYVGSDTTWIVDPL